MLYVIFISVKLLHRLMLFLTKVAFLGLPDYKVLDCVISQTWVKLGHRAVRVGIYPVALEVATNDVAPHADPTQKHFSPVTRLRQFFWPGSHAGPSVPQLGTLSFIRLAMGVEFRTLKVCTG